MGGNAMVEIIVFGARAGRYAAEYANGAKEVEFEDPSKPEYERLCSFFRDEGIAPKVIMDRIAAFMSEYVGVARRETDLKKALSELESLRADDIPRMRAPTGKCFNLGWIEAIQVPYMLDVAQMMIMSALHRTESRGAHFREDFPETKSEWLKHTCVTKKSDEMELGTTPVVITKCDPEGRV
jgi:succinate dehydrogenase/fumarate reductase flavoprotein subunit